MKIFFFEKQSVHIRNLARMAETFGVEVESIDIGVTSAAYGLLIEAIADLEGAVVFDVATLKDVFSCYELEQIASSLGGGASTVLLLVTSADAAVNRFLGCFSRGCIRAVYLSDAETARFPVAAGDFSGELSSYSYTTRTKKALGVHRKSAEASDVIMLLDQAETFISFAVEGRRVFCWSTSAVFDVLKTLGAEREFEEAVDQYAPAIIFFRYALKDKVWHNSGRHAALVIDDPLIRNKYGFIDFPDLLSSARRLGYHISLAFIPWNHWRCRTKDTRIFVDYADCFSVCTHGCDHTENEFLTSNYSDLIRKSHLAKVRVDRLTDRTGLGVEPIMVCPQENYSLEAMRAFSDSRLFLAFANTACIPRDSVLEKKVCGADLMMPAQDCFFGLPVFKRWNNQDEALLALGMFFGKPAILAEHHDFFRDGYKGIEHVVSVIQKIWPNVTWGSIMNIATTTHLRRRISEQEHEVRYFTDSFRWDHTDQRPVSYRFFRRAPDGIAVEDIEVNGKAVPFSRDGELLVFEVQAEKPEAFSVLSRITCTTAPDTGPSGMRYNVSVAWRRVLSEFRDNSLSRYPTGLRAARYLVEMGRRMRGTFR
jgi:hypothetical protein